MKAERAFEELQGIVEELDIDRTQKETMRKLLDDISWTVNAYAWYMPEDVKETYRRMYGEEISEELAQAISVQATIDAHSNEKLMKSMRYYLDRACKLGHDLRNS